MTNEEARRVLGDVSAYLASRAILQNETLAGHTFIDICKAIKSLEQQPSEDAISREAVIQIIENKLNPCTDMFKCLEMSEIKEDVEHLPSVTPQQARWIPCSERLPEDNIHVLCQFTLSGMGECYLAHGVFHVVGGLVMSCNEVIAWMPLPKPYKEDEQNES